MSACASCSTWKFPCTFNNFYHKFGNMAEVKSIAKNSTSTEKFRVSIYTVTTKVFITTDFPWMKILGHGTFICSCIQARSYQAFTYFTYVWLILDGLHMQIFKGRLHRYVNHLFILLDMFIWWCDVQNNTFN